MMRAILRSWAAKLLVSTAGAAALGLGLGLWLYFRSEPQRILRFEQPQMDLRNSPAIEGEPVEVVAQLRNYGKVPVRITNIAVCCGARLVPASEGGEGPSQVAPGASVPVALLIGTGSVSGERLARVQVEGQTPDGQEIVPAEFVVSIYVRSPLAAYPPYASFTLNEEELSSPVKQMIVLADLWPGEGLPIKSITSTLGDKLHYRLVPAQGEVWIGPRLLHKRYELELSLTFDPANPTFDHAVTITPDHPKAKPVEVRLAGKILPRCGLNTDCVSFCGTKPGEHLVRQIEYRYRHSSDREVRAVKAPPWLSVSISEVRDGLKVLTLDCCLPECKGARLVEARFEFGRNKQESVLPVVVSCSTGQ